MTMHLAHPAFSTTGKRKGKVKWRSAEHKRQAEKLEQEWQEKQRQWQSMSKPVKASSNKNLPRLGPPPGRESTKYIPSKDSGIGNAVKKDNPVYTGTKIVGIGTMHKSNAVPIFSDAEAKDISNMRR